MPIDPRFYTRGTVVMTKDTGDDQRIGHIDGFTRNSTGTAILRVAWEDGTVSAIHPSIVTLNPEFWPRRWSEKKCIEITQARVAKDEAAEQAPKPRSLLRRLITLSA